MPPVMGIPSSWQKDTVKEVPDDFVYRSVELRIYHYLAD